MNVAIVGSDYNFILNLGKSLAKVLCLKVLNIKEDLNEFLINSNLPLTIENEIYNYLENNCVNNFSNLNNSILIIPEDIYFSNCNYELLKNHILIIINSKNDKKIQLKLKKLIKNTKKIEINQENYELNEIIKVIRGYYDR